MTPQISNLPISSPNKRYFLWKYSYFSEFSVCNRIKYTEGKKCINHIILVGILGHSSHICWSVTALSGSASSEQRADNVSDCQPFECAWQFVPFAGGLSASGWRLADRCRSSISLSPPPEARTGPELYQPAAKYGRQEWAKTTTQQTTLPASVTAYLSQPSIRAWS